MCQYNVISMHNDKHNIFLLQVNHFIFLINRKHSADLYFHCFVCFFFITMYFFYSLLPFVDVKLSANVICYTNFI